MTSPAAFVRSIGNGANVVCLHSTLASSKQWSDLAQRLQSGYRVVSADLYGHGKSPDWDSSRSLTLDDEVDLLRPVLDSLTGPIHLVGHSYGGAVALRVAQRYRQRICSLVVYEPVAFALMLAAGPQHAAAGEITEFIDSVRWNYRAGRYLDATRDFIDYWSGPGTWDRFPGEQRVSLCQRIGTVLTNFEAVVSASDMASGFRGLSVPSLCLYGLESPRPTREIAGILATEMPNLSVRPLPGMGHMGPMTHGEAVNSLIECFLRSQQHKSAIRPLPFAA